MGKTANRHLELICEDATGIGHRFRMRIVIVAVLVVLVAVAAQAAEPPSLRLAKLTPLVLQGQRFHHLERVTVTVTVGGEHMQRRVTATTAGGFTAAFGVVPVSRCSTLFARAIGARGAVATLKRPPLPGCMPARTP
jgi:hypothetical protein